MRWTGTGQTASPSHAALGPPAAGSGPSSLGPCPSPHRFERESLEYSPGSAQAARLTTEAAPLGAFGGPHQGVEWHLEPSAGSSRGLCSSRDLGCLSGEKTAS